MNTARRPMYAWQDIPWHKVERAVFKLQQRIYRASRHGDVKTVHKLQRLLMKSWYGKLLATRRVTQDNRGKRTAGVDGIKSLTPPQRLRLAQGRRDGRSGTLPHGHWCPARGSAVTSPHECGPPRAGDSPYHGLSNLQRWSPVATSHHPVRR